MYVYDLFQLTLGERLLALSAVPVDTDQMPALLFTLRVF
jgi:hypothetical protein